MGPKVEILSHDSQLKFGIILRIHMNNLRVSSCKVLLIKSLIFKTVLNLYVFVNIWTDNDTKWFWVHNLRLKWLLFVVFWGVVGHQMKWKTTHFTHNLAVNLCAKRDNGPSLQKENSIKFRVFYLWLQR